MEEIVQLELTGPARDQPQVSAVMKKPAGRGTVAVPCVQELRNGARLERSHEEEGEKLELDGGTDRKAVFERGDIVDDVAGLVYSMNKLITASFEMSLQEGVLVDPKVMVFCERVPWGLIGPVVSDEGRENVFLIYNKLSDLLLQVDM